jgi:DNA-binding MarR family transcriptional regulator
MSNESEFLDTSAAFALAAELRVVVSQLGRRMRQSRPVGLNASQLATLSRLDQDGPSTVTALASAEGIRPQSMGTNISALEAVEFVQRSPDPEDGRKTILSLTPAGQAFVKEDRTARADWLFRAICTTINPVDLAMLTKSVDLLKLLAGS